MLNNKVIHDFKRFIHEINMSSAAIIHEYFRKPVEVDLKDDESPVTIADRKTEEHIRERIISVYPDHGILGEEYGEYNKDSEFIWVIDPIDGTKSFVCGAVTFGTLIGLMYRNQPIVGSIYFPALDEFLIGDGKQTFLNKKRTVFRSCSNLADAILLTTDAIDLYKTCPQLFNSVKFYRGLGDCYGYYLLATGFADIMIDPVMSPWDLLPLIPIINGAGGRITGIDGENAVSAQSAVAAHVDIHQTILTILHQS